MFGFTQFVFCKICYTQNFRGVVSMSYEKDFKDLPEGWKFSKVKDLFMDGRGRIISEEEIKNKEGIYPVYSSQTYNNGELGKINTYDFEGEFITWTTDGANAGTVFYRNGKFNCTNVCGILKPRNENINVKFFSYLLSTIAKNYVSYIGNPKLMNSTFRDIKIIYPDNYYEQQKIAEILETIDNAIEKTDKIIEKYKRIKQGLMQDLLTKGIDENGNIRDEKTHKFKDSQLGRIPEEWEVVRLGEVVEETYPGEWGDNPIDNENIFPVFSTLAIDYDGRIDFTKAVPRKLNKKKIEKLKLKKGMILIEKSGGSTDTPAGKVAILKQDFDGTCSNFIQILKIKYNFCNSYYLFYRLLYNFKNNLIEKYQQRTTGIINFILTDYFNEYIPLPPLHEQQRIAEILSQIDQTIEKEQQYKEKLQKIKQGLMQDLLTGKVRVNHLVEEKENEQRYTINFTRT